MSIKNITNKVFAHAFIWYKSRVILDLIFGLYKKRIAAIEELNLLGNDPSVLDLGCGVGLFAEITRGYYLGIDSNQRYINYAKKRKYEARKIFECLDLTQAWDIDRNFDIILIADLLHHLNQEERICLLRKCYRIDAKYLICYDPILLKKMSLIDKLVLKYDQAHNFLNRKEIDKLFQENNYEIIEYKYVRMGLLRNNLMVYKPIKHALK